MNHDKGDIKVMKKYQQQLQEQVQLSAYDMKCIQDILEYNLEFLEIFMEKLGISFNKQLPRTVTREDILRGDAKKVLRTLLLENTALNSAVSDKEDFLLEPFKNQFLSWLDRSGVSVDNCPLELAEVYKNINDILSGQGKEFAERRSQEVNKNIAKMTQQEREQAFSRFLNDVHGFRNEEYARERSMRGQVYKFDIQNKFHGNSEEGQSSFAQIKSKLENAPKQVSGHRVNSDIIVDNKVYEPASSWDSQLSSQERAFIAQESQSATNQSNEKYYLVAGGSLLATIGGWGAWLFKLSLR